MSAYHHTPDLDDATGNDRFEHPDGTPDRDAIRRAERFAFTWWGGTGRDLDPWGDDAA